jgi:pimeloyl-ACP methyl ester carboxylesterase/DNA-binding CsgD family transcriptional regulator
MGDERSPMTADAQHIRFCTSRDGVRIAYAVTGDGPPLVRTATWLGHLEYEWQNLIRRPTLEELSRHYSLVRYDQRGCGLSDRHVENISFEAWVGDLETVVEAAGLRRFSLLGASQGCAIAIAYAARFPDKVSHLMLCGGYALGRLKRDLSERQREEARTLIKLIELGWGKETAEFRQVFTMQFMPDATQGQQRAFDEWQRMSTSPENAVRIVGALDLIDVREDAARIRCPTIVLHARGDARIPFDEGRRLAALIPGARFVPLESRNHALLSSEPAWRQFVDEVVAFPKTAIADSSASGRLPALTDRESAVLELIAQGVDNGRIAAALSLSEKTVRNYVTSLFDKLQVSTRSQAIVLAREAGYGHAVSRPPH